MAVPLTLPHTFPRTGMAGYRFDGVDDYISVPDSPSLDITDAITVAAWMRSAVVVDSIPAQGGVGKWDFPAGSASYLIRTDDLNMWAGNVSTSDDVFTVCGGTINLRHQHVVMTYDGSMLLLYVDGVKVGSTPATGSISTTDQSVEVGRYDSTRHFNGAVSEVVILAEALSDEDVRKLYEGRVMPTSFDCRLWLPLYEHHTKDRSGHENHGINHGAIYEVSG